MVRLANLSLLVMLGLVLPGFSGAAAADAPAGDPGCRVTAAAAGCASRWASGNRYLIRAGSAGRDVRLEWQYDIAENRDLRIGVTAARGAETETGTVFLIENEAMLAHGLTLTPGQEIDALGVPILSLQLVLDLLERTIPDGPPAVSGRRQVRDADDAVLKITTRGAKGVIPAPWRLDGTVERISPSTLSFDLTLAFRPIPGEADESVLTFSGFWEERPAPPTLPDATTIEGWAVHRLTRNIDAGSGTAPDAMRAMPVRASFPTLGSLRRYLLTRSPGGTPPR